MDHALLKASWLAGLLLAAAPLRPVLAQDATPTPPVTSSATGSITSDPERNREISRIRSERGLDVCRLSSDGTRKYQGITQGYERGRVQILVRVLDAKTGEPVAGVRETNVWDDPANWTICAP